MKVTELVEPVLFLEPSLVSRVDLTGLASSKQQAASKQASKQGSKQARQQARAKWAKITAPSWCFGFGQNLLDGTYGCEGQPLKV